MHQKIKTLFCHIRFDYMTNFVKKRFVFLSLFFLLSIRKEKKNIVKEGNSYAGQFGGKFLRTYFYP